MLIVQISRTGLTCLYIHLVGEVSQAATCAEVPTSTVLYEEELLQARLHETAMQCSCSAWPRWEGGVTGGKGRWRIGEPESRRVGGSESRRVGESESRRAGESESRREEGVRERGREGDRERVICIDIERL